MQGDESPVERFWRTYLGTLQPGPLRQDLTYTAWAFGNTSEMADGLGELVMQRVKTATASLAWAYEAEEEPIPEAGDFSIILDGRGEPMCIIETIGVEIVPFDQVGAKHAFDEGEGDRSLEYWQEVHWTFFTEECQAIGRKPAQNMPVVCERFRLVYPN